MVDDQDIQSRSIKKYDHKSQVCGPFFGEGNLFIEMKILKNEEEGIEEDQNNGFQEQDQMNNNKRVCRFCNKVFSSGKALGGHMRIHVQANKDLAFKKKLKAYQSVKFKKQKYLPEDEDRVIDFVKKKKHYEGYNKNQTCIICRKHFPSEKSLFGHMRCHPERDWRGIHPPTMARNSSWSSSSFDAETQKMDDQIDNWVDLTKSLKGWSVTAKRGRNAMVASSSEISSLEDDELRDAVNDLMMLAHGDSYESGLTNRQKVDESDAANSTSLNSKAEVWDISPVSKLKKQIIEETYIDELGSSIFENLEYLQAKSVIDVGEATDVPRTGLILEKPVVEFEHEDSSDDKKKYSETSYGNVTKKNKKRRKKVKLSDLELVQNASPMLALQPDKYNCSTCDRSFPTHQALGGHRSSHTKIKIWVDEEISNPIVQLADETKESEASNICRRALDFDLNEVPPPEDETGIESELVVSN
ncbi:uncharacterized protein LOC111395478 [Olea europaea var. sylvestris]|uniref:uncharacterized protein LOC111395478 n=1 Tax=Olea europaea var. sylvestris TaxID=158386 RepID=UPI000C1CDE8F|nr:uncharacterized protein LOC111395478 [Olea europaea var. sylvestris]